MFSPAFPLSSLTLLLSQASVQALEYPVGHPQTGAGLEVAALYLQPVEMEPADGRGVGEVALAGLTVVGAGTGDGGAGLA